MDAVFSFTFDSVRYLTSFSMLWRRFYIPILTGEQGSLLLLYPYLT